MKGKFGNVKGDLEEGKGRKQVNEKLEINNGGERKRASESGKEKRKDKTMVCPHVSMMINNFIVCYHFRSYLSCACFACEPRQDFICANVQIYVDQP